MSSASAVPKFARASTKDKLESREKTRLGGVLRATALRAASQPVTRLSNELLSYIFLLGTRAEEFRIMALNECEREGDLKQEYGYEGENLLVKPAPPRSSAKLKRDVRRAVAKARRIHACADSTAKLSGAAIHSSEQEHKQDNAAPSVQACPCGASDDDDIEILEILRCTNGSLPFQVLVSHVCQQWRTLAVNTPFLWTTIISTNIAPHEVARARLWISRAGGLPLNLYIDVSFSEMRMTVVPAGTDEWNNRLFASEEEMVTNALTMFGTYNNALAKLDEASLDLRVADEIKHAYKCSHIYKVEENVEPDEYALYHLAEFLHVTTRHLHTWKNFTFVTSTGLSLRGLAEALSTPEILKTGVPMLEQLTLKYIDNEWTMDALKTFMFLEFNTLFGGVTNLPKLRIVKLTDVGKNFDVLLPAMAQSVLRRTVAADDSTTVGQTPSARTVIEDLRLVWDRKRTICMRFTRLRDILQSSSALTRLNLTGWKPQVDDNDLSQAVFAGDTLRLLALRSLHLARIKPSVMVLIARMLYAPQLEELTIDVAKKTYFRQDIEALSEMVDYMAHPRPCSERSLFSGLKTFRLLSFYSTKRAIWTMFEALENLTTLELNNYTIPGAAYGLVCNPALEAMKFFHKCRETGRSTDILPGWLKQGMQWYYDGDPNWMQDQPEWASVEGFVSLAMMDHTVCPNLEELVISAVLTELVCGAVRYRAKHGAPLKRLRFTEEDGCNKTQKKYLCKMLERVEVFHLSADKKQPPSVEVGAVDDDYDP